MKTENEHRFGSIKSPVWTVSLNLITYENWQFLPLFPCVNHVYEIIKYAFDPINNYAYNTKLDMNDVITVEKVGTECISFKAPIKLN